jgi:hypothetical protein
MGHFSPLQLPATNDSLGSRSETFSRLSVPPPPGTLAQILPLISTFPSPPNCLPLSDALEPGPLKVVGLQRSGI